jgi:hypothetical protein
VNIFFTAMTISSLTRPPIRISFFVEAVRFCKGFPSDLLHCITNVKILNDLNIFPELNALDHQMMPYTRSDFYYVEKLLLEKWHNSEQVPKYKHHWQHSSGSAYFILSSNIYCKKGYFARTSSCYSKQHFWNLSFVTLTKPK